MLLVVSSGKNIGRRKLTCKARGQRRSDGLVSRSEVIALFWLEKTAGRDSSQRRRNRQKREQSSSASLLANTDGGQPLLWAGRIWVSCRPRPAVQLHPPRRRRVANTIVSHRALTAIERWLLVSSTMLRSVPVLSIRLLPPSILIPLLRHLCSSSNPSTA